MSRVEDVALRLAAIQDELTSLPEGPSLDRYDLLKEQDILRAEAGVFGVHVDTERSTKDLVAELESLKQRRKSIVSSRSGYVMGKGGNSAGPASGAWVKLSAESQSASGLDQLNVRISRIEDVLAARRDAQDRSEDRT